MSDNNYFVYQHVTPDNMVYVGISQQDKKLRWRSNQYESTSLQPYIDKFGWDKIRHEVLKEGLTKKEAQELENELILKYGSEGMRINKYGSGGWRSDIEEVRKRAREYERVYREENSDKLKEYDKKRYLENKEKRIGLVKEYYNKHREERIEYLRRYRKEHREELNEKQRQKRKNLLT